MVLYSNFHFSYEGVWLGKSFDELLKILKIHFGFDVSFLQAKYFWLVKIFTGEKFKFLVFGEDS